MNTPGRVPTDSLTDNVNAMAQSSAWRASQDNPNVLLPASNSQEALTGSNRSSTFRQTSARANMNASPIVQQSQELYGAGGSKLSVASHNDVQTIQNSPGPNHLRIPAIVSETGGSHPNSSRNIDLGGDRTDTMSRMKVCINAHTHAAFPTSPPVQNFHPVSQYPWPT